MTMQDFKNVIWKENFTIARSGYYLLTPIFSSGFFSCQKDFFGKEFPLIIDKGLMIYRGTDAEGYFPEDQLLNLVDALMKSIINDLGNAERINKETYKLNDEYFSIAKKVLNSNPDQLSHKEIGKLLTDLFKLQGLSHARACTTTWFIDSVGETFSKYLLKKTEEIVKKSGKDMDYAAVFSKLTTFAENSITLSEELDSLKILKIISQDQEAKNIFIGLKDFLKIPEGISEEIRVRINSHFQKWRWLQFNYMGPAYEIDYFLTVWKGLLNDGINIDEEIAKIKLRPSRVSEERKQLIYELNINDSDKRLFDLAADIVFLKGYRKEAMFHGQYALSYILKDAAKKMFLSLNQMYLLTHIELINFYLKNETTDVNEINDRAELSVVFCSPNGLKIYSGTEAKRILSQLNIKKEEVNLNVSELHGTTACSGNAKGIVKIINTIEEISKMEEGDIMVAHSTFPSLVPAMKKAAAIITEDGGITCHAAIVSREMGTPCVTGIKAATKVLKDGDMVEVDASLGIVKIVKRLES